VSWWPGDGHALDISGGNDGILINGAIFASGVVGQAYSFDGVNGRVEASGTNINDLQQLTIDAWVKHNSLSGSTIQRYVSLSGEKAVLRKHTWNKLDFYMTIDGELRTIRVIDVLQVGVFHHVAGTYDGSVMRLYLDGVEVGNLAVSGTVGVGNGVVFSGSETLDGLLDEVEIYNRALSASEIQAIFNAGSAGKCKLPTELWDYSLDDGQGSGNMILSEEQDGSIRVLGSWIYNYSDSDVTGSITDGSATITGTYVSIIATGDAFNPGAPEGYNLSGFDMTVNGTTNNRQMDGTYSLSFYTPGWPSLSGAVQGTRTGGAAITENWLDTDGDGMPDGWEVSYELDPLRDDASADCDRDGFSNLVEYLKGTAPNDPNSHPPRAMSCIPLLLFDN
jgi:hypothetical protein